MRIHRRSVQEGVAHGEGRDWSRRSELKGRAPTQSPTVRRLEDQLSPQGLMILLAFCYGAFAQGAFFGSQLFVLEVALLVAVVLGFLKAPPRRADIENPATIACITALFALCLSAAHADSLAAVVPQGLFLLVLLGVVLAVLRLERPAAELLLNGTIAATSVVAFLGWLAVATHAQPGALINGALWRASTTVSYANAAACLFAMSSLVAVARTVAVRSRWSEMGSFVVLVGLGATLSRGALLGFVVGFGFLVLVSGVKLLETSWPLLVGALVAVGGLVPSLPASGEPYPVVAAVAYVLGALVVGSRWVLTSRQLGVGVLVLSSALMGVLIFHRPAPVREGVELLSTQRVARDISVEDRQHRWAEFLEIANAHPVLGAGPGGFLLRYPNPRRVDVGRFAHNEYLQILGEQGAIGFGAVILGMTLMARSFLRMRRREWLWTGGGSALAVFVIQGAFDFVWNVPLIPVYAAMLYAAGSGRDERQ